MLEAGMDPKHIWR
jgi:hypothetical protein